MAEMSGSPSYRCADCKSASENPRNLVVFIDGTSNKPGGKNTNVVKLYDAVIDEGIEASRLEQHKYYRKGIGAYEPDQLSWLGRRKKKISNRLEQALARNVDKNIKDAYHWLAERYQQGDQIYLFGFSRGGFQVRALASMIHEVGLVKERRVEVESAYNHYQAIDPYNPETRRQATRFKKTYCWQDVRIHFVGVWDTVSSLGIIKKDVHITASASVTNACHFRHALALDECRVKFLPEYFREMNTHHGEIESARRVVGDVKEVWFAGFHGDVGGAKRQPKDLHSMHSEDDHIESYIADAGKVPLLWMRREAANKGLVFKPTEFAWDPEDVDLGIKDSMPRGSFWRVLEYLPIRHQVSFSGTGKHEWRFHKVRPRTIIPGQQIHTSVLSGYMYTPRATLGDGIRIPTVKQNSLEGLWTAGLLDEDATTRLLSSLLSDQNKTLRCLGEVLFLLDFMLESGQIQSIRQQRWSEEDIQVPSRSDFARFALVVIYDVTSESPASEKLVASTKEYLCTTLPNPNSPDLRKTLDALQFFTRHQTFRRRFCDNEVIGALVLALARTATNHVESPFPLVTDTLCNLIRDNSLRGNVIEQLTTMRETGETAQPILSVALKLESPHQLAALLRMIATPGRESIYSDDFRGELQCKVLELAKKEERPVGPAAVEALVALDVSITRDIHISNILGYLCNILPRLDAEGGSTASVEGVNDPPPVFPFEGFGPLSEELVGKIVSTIDSCNPRERTEATLTVVKLCRNATIRQSCTQNKVLHIFMCQLKKKRTSLLAAYALNMCLKYNDMWSPGDFSSAAQLIVAMFNKGWFDDAVGQVEGCKILRELMTSGDLRQCIDVSSVCATLVRKLEAGERHEVRMSLLCLDILGTGEPLQLKQIVADNVNHLRAEDKKVQIKGVKVLAALALTAAGEQTIKSHLIEIVKMMLPPPGGSPVPRDQLLGPAAALYDLSKNETLRKQILAAREFGDLKNRLQHAAVSQSGAV